MFLLHLSEGPQITTITYLSMKWSGAYLVYFCCKNIFVGSVPWKPSMAWTVYGSNWCTNLHQKWRDSYRLNTSIDVSLHIVRRCVCASDGWILFYQFLWSANNSRFSVRKCHRLLEPTADHTDCWKYGSLPSIQGTLYGAQH